MRWVNKSIWREASPLHLRKSRAIVIIVIVIDGDRTQRKGLAQRVSSRSHFIVLLDFVAVGLFHLFLWPDKLILISSSSY